MQVRVKYGEDIEPLVSFIEETPRSEIIEKTYEKLRAGTDIKTMLKAAVLAVTRSTDLPPGHHGGPLHPMAGLYAIYKLTERLEGDDKFLPVVQHVALANKHVHDPVTGPYALLEFAPLDVTGGAESQMEHVAADGTGKVSDAKGIEAAKQAFLKAVDRGESNKADHLFQWMWQNLPKQDCFNLMMDVAIVKNGLDDHYFMFPAVTWRAMEEVIGTDYLTTLMRPPVRYTARFPAPRTMPEIEALIETHQLLDRIIPQRSSDAETAHVGRLGEAIGATNDYNEIPPMLAEALVEGLSLEGAGEALSIGAASLFLRSLTGNPMDVHMHTSVNLRRWLLKMEGLSRRNKLLILLTWHMGPEIRSTQYRMEATAQPDQAEVAKLPHLSQGDLLDAIEQSIYNQPPTDWAQVTNLGRMRAVPEVKGTVNLAQQYVNLGYDADAFILRLGRIVCHDSFTEMHSFKHHQAIVEEFHSTRGDYKWMHLVSGAMAAAISFGKNMEVYEGALELLHAA
ncbi:MAG: hypothetical protein EXR07_04810 [Acetobacteraceae bacterium]|nr:hypothetical protein [Acetobacteraceae bacterium]